MQEQQTGEQQAEIYCEALSKQFRRMAERCDLDIVETEELIVLGSTIAEKRTLSIAQALQMLMSGWKESELIMSDTRIEDGVIQAALQAIPNVRYAAVLRKPGKPPKLTAFIGG